MPKVSVIVPCFNAAEYLDRCMNYLLLQTIGMEHLQIILVDDASTDHGQTLQKMMEYESKYPKQIVVIPLEENMRQGGARNIGLFYASGEYVLYCDADDWMIPQVLERLYDLAISYDCDVVEFDNLDVQTYDTSDDILRSREDDEYWEINSEDDRKNYLVSERSTPGCWNKLFRTSMLKENNIRYAEHVIMEEPAFTFMVRFFEKTHYYVHEVLHYCYQHSGSTMRSSYEKRKFDHMITIDTLYADIVSRGFDVKYRNEVQFIFWYWYFFTSLIIAVGRNVFYDEKEFEEIQIRTREVVPDIRCNKYFQEKLAGIPELGEITYCDVNQLDLKMLYEGLYGLISGKG